MPVAEKQTEGASQDGQGKTNLDHTGLLARSLFAHRALGRRPPAGPLRFVYNGSEMTGPVQYPRAISPGNSLSGVSG